MLVNKLNEIRADKDEREGGFTLIELLVVVVIIGILIAIAIPLYLNYQKGAGDKSAQSDLRAAVSAYNQCYTDNSNAYVAESGATGLHAASYTLSCGGTTENVNLSSGTSIQATVTTTSFLLTASNSGGHDATGGLNGKKTFTYNSTNGGSIS